MSLIWVWALASKLSTSPFQWDFNLFRSFTGVDVYIQEYSHNPPKDINGAPTKTNETQEYAKIAVKILKIRVFLMVLNMVFKSCVCEYIYKDLPRKVRRPDLESM